MTESGDMGASRVRVIFYFLIWMLIIEVYFS